MWNVKFEGYILIIISEIWGEISVQIELPDLNGKHSSLWKIFSTMHFNQTWLRRQIFKLKRHLQVYWRTLRPLYFQEDNLIFPPPYQNKVMKIRLTLHYHALTCHASIMPGWRINNSSHSLPHGKLVQLSPPGSGSLQGSRNNTLLLGSCIWLNPEARNSSFWRQVRSMSPEKRLPIQSCSLGQQWDAECRDDDIISISIVGLISGILNFSIRKEGT